MRLVPVVLAFQIACAPAGASHPHAKVAAKPVECSGHGVVDGGGCLCFPGDEGEKCDATGGAYAKALLAVHEPKQANVWIQRARHCCCKYVPTMTVAAAYGDIAKLDALLAGHLLDKCDVTSVSPPMLWSAVTGAAASVNYLLEHHVTPNVSTAQGYSALMTAARLQRLGIMKL